MPDTILVVEDEVFIRVDVAEHLEACGFAVLEADSAAAAIAQIERHPEVNLVFTDVRMPGAMDGLDLARWVATHRPRIVVMLASGDVGRSTAMRELCHEHAFHKPYRLEDVSQAMRRALQARRGAAT